MRWLIELISAIFGRKKPEVKHENVEEKPEVTVTEEVVEEITPVPDESKLNITNKEMTDFSRMMVHIDNGHAKSTPGKRSPYAASKTKPALELYEYKSNRDIAAILERKLREKGFATHMVTPEVDNDVALTARANRANSEARKNPALKHIFISIHSDACGNGSQWHPAKGWSAYTTKGQNNSDKLAECLYEAADEILPKYGFNTRGDKSDGDSDYEEDFTVIYKADMPAVLTENLYFTNVKETEFLLSDEGKDALAEIHLRGIMKYAEKVL